MIHVTTVRDSVEPRTEIDECEQMGTIKISMLRHDSRTNLKGKPVASHN